MIYYVGKYINDNTKKENLVFFTESNHFFVWHDVNNFTTIKINKQIISHIICGRYKDYFICDYLDYLEFLKVINEIKKS